jgi:hypothetical protein
LTLYYVAQDGTRTHLMAASLRAAPTLAVTSRRIVLPDVRMEEVENHPNYDVSESGAKFIMPESAPTIALGVIFDVSSSLNAAPAHRR